MMVGGIEEGKTHPPSVAEFEAGRSDRAVGLASEEAGQAAVTVHHWVSMQSAFPERERCRDEVKSYFACPTDQWSVWRAFRRSACV